ncbi:Txe/YoeB family addiction module toxin [Nocardioides sp.]|uniref:Txe/YoeB family addiction module toxin n=1 Tax=Nocardioides sp. TaxID=35761 RepID=UPI0026343225|nr:Txe/YoeB family addiction module toxin [Nocardioides sp.]
MARILAWTPGGWDDYVHSQQADRTLGKRINRLLTDVLRDPFEGIGKPEPLKYGAPNAWSRRITEEHRLVYLVHDDQIVVLQARYHY